MESTCQKSKPKRRKIIGKPSLARRGEKQRPSLPGVGNHRHIWLGKKMDITSEKFLNARKKYLESLTDEEREEIENTRRKAHLEARLEAEKRGDEFKEKYPHIVKIYEDNLHHIKAKNILKDAIQTAIDNPAMTPELKSTGELFINLLELTGNSFEYDPDAVIEPVKEIVEKDTRSQSGKKAINERHDKPGGAREKKKT